MMNFRFTAVVARIVLASNLLCGFCAATMAADTPASPSTPAPKPNVIVILADDLGIANLSCYGGDSFKTPHLDALAASGVRFQQCYSAPNCGPSRAMMLTGRYGFRTGMTGNDKPAVKMMESGVKTEVMIPKLLKPLGYATAMAGKWSQVPLEPSDWGFDEYLRFSGSGAYWPTPEHASYTENGVEKPWASDAYGPDIQERFVFDFIDRHREQPFYIHYSLQGVHSEIQKTPDSSTDSADFYVDNMVHMDKLVGRLVAELERLKIRDNTLVMFAGDNGTVGGEAARSTIGGRPLSGSKGTLLEGGSRVPLIASWPKAIQAGRVCDDLISFTDFLPSIAEVAGAKLPEGQVIDGRSFAPQMRGEKGDPREWVFVMLGRHWYVREAGWKFTDEGDLFDMSDAPFEEKPVAADGAGPEAVAARSRLAGVLAELNPAAGKLGDETGKKAKPAKTPKEKDPKKAAKATSAAG
jgi:arylsulfatase A